VINFRSVAAGEPDMRCALYSLFVSALGMRPSVAIRPLITECFTTQRHVDHPFAQHAADGSGMAMRSTDETHRGLL
jgi:hypothetical protein